MKSLVLRLAAVVSVGIGASACSSVPDWVDPTTWLDSKSPPAADNGRATDLADIPGKPATTTPDEQKQVAQSLAADRAQSSYSAEQLRADAEQSSAPPPPPPPPESTPSLPAPESNKTEAKAPEQTASAAPTSYRATPRPPVTEAPTSSAPTDVAPAPAEPPANSEPAPAASQADSSLEFQPSAAPPLDPTVSQFAPPSVISRYQQTASVSAAPAEDTTQSAALASTGVAAGAPAAVIFFQGDGIALDATARAKVHDVAAEYQSKGGAGFVRVVGHSSSRTANMPAQKHVEMIFQRSQDRANAVASELIRDGVPAAKVLVEAVGDSQPTYAESMPKGEEGNRRAEIFLQS